MGRPAVRFETTTGLASSPDNPVDIRGDAALSIMLVMNLQPHRRSRRSTASSASAIRPRPETPAGPWRHSCRSTAARITRCISPAAGTTTPRSGEGSFKPLYGKPVMLTIIKRPGPMRSTTRLFINGVAATGQTGGPLEGRDTVPDIQHRSDIGAYLGKALTGAAAIRGDVGEVIVYNKALADAERQGVEGHLAEKFGLWLDTPQHKAAAGRVHRGGEGLLGVSAGEESRSAGRPGRSLDEVAGRPLHSRELEQRRLKPAAPADKRTLLRRVTFDLTGLPPTPEEIDAFLDDDSPQAFEKVVDRLLASPHYGERWGRHWLDVVRYAETTANDANAVMRYAWRYRDYVDRRLQPATCPTTSSSSSNWPATCCRRPIDRREHPRGSSPPAS